MFNSSIIWDDENDPKGIVQHVAEHDLTAEDVETVLATLTCEGHSNFTGFPALVFSQHSRARREQFPELKRITFETPPPDRMNRRVADTQKNGGILSCRRS